MQPLSEHTQHLFDQRRFGELSETALREFDQRLANDPTLAQQWSEYLALTEGLKQRFAATAAVQADDDLRRRIAQAAAEMEAGGFFTEKKEQPMTATSVRISPVRRYWALAAGLALALAAVWFFSRPTPPGGEEMFAAYFRIEQTQLSAALDDLEKFSLGEADAASRQDLAAALTLVEKKQFAEAIPLLRSWLPPTAPAPTTPRADRDLMLARYYLAQANMATGDTGEETLALLTAVVNDPAASFAGDARWHLALCYLKNERPDAARPLLQTVAAGVSTHATEAARLLSQIH